MYKIENRILIIFLEIICAMFLVACSSRESFNDFYQLNDSDDLEYLKFKPTSILYSNDPNIILPKPSVDYIIPIINNIDKYKLGLQLDISPPVVLHYNISCETCFKLMYE